MTEAEMKVTGEPQAPLKSFRIVCDTVTCDYSVEQISEREVAENHVKANQFYHNSVLYAHCPGRLFVIEEKGVNA